MYFQSQIIKKRKKLIKMKYYKVIKIYNKIHNNNNKFYLNKEDF